MTIPFRQGGFALPVHQDLLTRLTAELAKTELDITSLTSVTFNFRDPNYSAEAGGIHPVEIRLIRGLDGWLFDYVTDFSYQGQGWCAELCKELDFNFLDNEHYLQGWGPLPSVEARELFAMWQASFLAFCEMGCFTVTVTNG